MDDANPKLQKKINESIENNVNTLIIFIKIQIVCNNIFWSVYIYIKQCLYQVSLYGILNVAKTKVFDHCQQKLLCTVTTISSEDDECLYFAFCLVCLS